MLKLPIYLDYSATTPVDPRCGEDDSLSCRNSATPASRSHQLRLGSRRGGRERACRSGEAGQRRCQGNRLDLGRDRIEQSSRSRALPISIPARASTSSPSRPNTRPVLDTFRELERQGLRGDLSRRQDNGLIDSKQFKAALRPDTILVSVMFVNNEIGVIQPIAEIGEICRSKGIIFHVDAAQATGKVDIDLGAEGRPDELLGPQDLRSEGHRRLVRAPQTARPPRSADAWRRPRTRFPLRHAAGAHQIVGMGEAFRIAREEMVAENERIGRLRDQLLKGLRTSRPPT